MTGLQGQQADGAHAEDGDGVAQAHVAVAHRAQGEIGRVEADGGLPGNAVGKGAHRLGPDVFLAQGTVGEDAVADFEFGDFGTDFDDFTDAHITEANGIAYRVLVVPGEDAVFAIKTAAGAGVAFVHGHLGAVFDRAEEAFDAHLAGCERGIVVFGEGDLFAGGSDEFSGHGSSFRVSFTVPGGFYYIVGMPLRGKTI